MATGIAFLAGQKSAPPPFDPPFAKTTLKEIEAAAKSLGDEDKSRILRLIKDRAARELLTGVFGNSPYLTRIITQRTAEVARMMEKSPEETIEGLIAEALAYGREIDDEAELMRALRRTKVLAALAIALADLAGIWSLEEVTKALTRFADATVESALSHLLRRGMAKGHYAPADPADPARDSGIIILAMGKYGAYELNYSSDIDIIVFFDAEKVPVTSEVFPQAFCVDLAKGIIRILQSPTEDGYVHRVDLRLRPDAGATQVAISTEAAEFYYESMGQNWERAAMIKARACAADIPAGELFLKGLVPFIWRKYLDFAAIEDVHSLKRQIHEKVGHAAVRVVGHNIKLGRGGIREIEFFAQTQQLILGGREPALRHRATVPAIGALTDMGFVTSEARDELAEAYDYLRTLEHRLQMVNDQQTHAVPRSPAAVHRIARFAGYKKTQKFGEELTRHLVKVTQHYGALFEGEPPLSEEAGNLVFTGVEDDPDTIKTLQKLGFERPRDIAAAIRGWHHGRLRATRSERAREILTKLMPLILKYLADTPAPDLAFARFHDFLAGLPSGVQFFSLMANNPTLLELIVDAVGIAPRLARYLARHSAVLDALLEPEYLQTLPDNESLEADITDVIARAPHFEETLIAVRRWAREQSFRIGIQVLQGTASAEVAGPAFTDLANITISALQPVALRDIERTHGKLPGSDMAVLGLGKLGGAEMSATSDLDLIFIYALTSEEAQSDGERPLPGTQYYARASQRLINALTAQTSEGGLYEVDMRLRPSGAAGPIAARIESFEQYHKEQAWTWERMALTRARILTGGDALRARLAEAIRTALCTPRDRKSIAKDVVEMRERLAREHPSSDPWSLKHVHGRMIDVEFIAQTLQLFHAPEDPRVLDTNTRLAFKRLEVVGALKPKMAEDLISATRLFHNITQILRLAVDEGFAPQKAAPGLRDLLAKAAGTRSFQETEQLLRKTQSRIDQLFEELVGRVAG